MSRALNDPENVPKNYGSLSSGSNNGGASTSALSNLDVQFSGFSPTEFMSLCDDIANNISIVNESTKGLEKQLKLIGTPREQPSVRHEVHRINEKANQRIATATKDLAHLTSLVNKVDKQQKLLLERLTADFKLIVEKCSALQQRVATAMRRAFVQSQVGQLEDAQTESDRAQLLQEQQAIQAGLQFEHDMLADRERQILLIEGDILDVNAVMKQLSQGVHAQREMIDDIESTIERTAAEVESGREELQKASRHRQSYRRKILILLVIAVIIGLIVTGVIVGKLTS